MSAITGRGSPTRLAPGWDLFQARRNCSDFGSEEPPPFAYRGSRFFTAEIRKPPSATPSPSKKRETQLERNYQSPYR